jgi:Stress responsive A/B Barrel Domain
MIAHVRACEGVAVIRHIVAFRLTPQEARERSRTVKEIHDRLTALVPAIPGLRSMDVAPDLGIVEGHWHLVLVSEHDDSDALEAYQRDPRHVEASAWVGQFVVERAVVDYAL